MQESLTVLLDSPLSKSGKLLVYMHSIKDSIVVLNPRFKVPRNFQKFACQIADVLSRGEVRVSSMQVMKLLPSPL